MSQNRCEDRNHYGAAQETNGLPAAESAGKHGRRANPAPQVPVWLTAIAAVLVLAALPLSFGQALRMSDHNEEMYIAAAVRVAGGEVPYRDFSYVQMPYLPYLQAGLLRLLGMANPLLVARVFNWVTWVGGAGLTYLACRLAGGPRLVSLVFSLLYLTNPFMLRVTHEASTYAPPATMGIGQAVACLWLGLPTCGRWRPAIAGLVGVLGGLAVGVKLYFLPVVLPYLCLAGFAESGRFNRTHLACAIGGFCLALSPAALFYGFMQQKFLFNNLMVHGLVTAAYRELNVRTGGLVPNMTVPSKARFIAWGIFSSPTIVATLVAALWSWRHLSDGFVRGGSRSVPHVLAAAMAAVMAIAVACFMTPCYPQYVSLMMPYLILLAGLLSSDVLPRYSRACSILCLGAGAVAFASFVDVDDARAVLHPSQAWQPLRKTRAGAEIRSVIQEHGSIGRLATVQPLHAINAGMPFYDEFATGPFVYFVADAVADEDQRRYKIVGRRRIEELFDGDPPAAILVGLYPDGWVFSDDALRSYAETRGYVKHGLSWLPKASLYIRPKTNQPGPVTDPVDAPET